MVREMTFAALSGEKADPDRQLMRTGAAVRTEVILSPYRNVYPDGSSL
jgi:hypothetical protein